MNDIFVPWPEAKKISGNKSRTTIWRWERQGLFPKRIPIGPNSVAWSYRQLMEWQKQKMGGPHA